MLSCQKARRQGLPLHMHHRRIASMPTRSPSSPLGLRPGNNTGVRVLQVLQSQAPRGCRRRAQFLRRLLCLASISDHITAPVVIGRTGTSCLPQDNRPSSSPPRCRLCRPSERRRPDEQSRADICTAAAAEVAGPHCGSDAAAGLGAGGPQRVAHDAPRIVRHAAVGPAIGGSLDVRSGRRGPLASATSLSVKRVSSGS